MTEVSYIHSPFASGDRVSFNDGERRRRGVIDHFYTFPHGNTCAVVKSRGDEYLLALEEMKRLRD